MRPPPPPAPEAAALAAVPSTLARRAGLLPLTLRDGVLRVGTAAASGTAPDDAAARRRAEVLEEVRVRAGAVAVETVPVVDPVAGLLLAEAGRTLASATTGGTDAVAVVDAALDAAVGRDASDVHLEPTPEGLRLRLRRDGDLHDLATLPAALRDAVVARIKVRAGLDVAERRAAQDGRMVHPTPGGDVAVRVATLPARHGERVTLRLLPRGPAAALDRLGLPGAVVAALAGAGAARDGLVVLCGPTGSGKTTTLHALLGRLAGGSRAVMTLEDPVEREVPGATQTQVDAAAGLTFAAGLRHLLRHDPDVLLVGEVRDAETAVLALEAARTGHLVLTTLHAVDAPGAVDRLADLGLPAARVVPVLRLIVAQRLHAVPCPGCAAGGCRDCDGTGTRGRTAVAEAVSFDAALRADVLGAPDAAGRRRLLDAAAHPRPDDLPAARAAAGPARTGAVLAAAPGGRT